MPQTTNLNLHQKLLKIANMAGVLQKNKSGFNYTYTTEDEIQAKITAGMQKYGVNLYPSIEQGSLTVTPYSYKKVKSKKVDGKIVEYEVPVNEVIVSAEVIYTWVNAENPDEKIENRWAYIGQMEDASQAFGSGATYGNRYYLLKALQLATTEDDPDDYRSKQKAAEKFEEEQLLKEQAEKLAEVVKKVRDMGTKLISAKIDKSVVRDVVGKHNNGNPNASSITDIAIGEAILKEFEAILNSAENK